MEFKFPLGAEAKDIITGFSGIIRWRVEYITGCNQYGIQPPVDKDGKVPDAMQFDENSIKITGKGVKLPKYPKSDKSDEEKKEGGPQPKARKRD